MPEFTARQPAWIVCTLPIAPSQIHSQNRRIDSDEWPWLPSCVTTLCSWAAFISSRTSYTECASGFSQYTCLPRLIAAIAATAWVWSGVATTTASICFSISSNILRKSRYGLASGNFWNVPPERF